MFIVLLRVHAKGRVDTVCGVCGVSEGPLCSELQAIAYAYFDAGGSARHVLMLLRVVFVLSTNSQPMTLILAAILQYMA